MIALVLAFVRTLALLTLLPVFGASAAPRWVAGLLALGCAALVAPSVPEPDASGPGSLVRAVAVELLFGSGAGLVVRASFAALGLASEVAAQQSGFGSVALGNPVTDAHESPYGVLATLLGAAVFLATGQHLALLIALSDSFARWPPGAPPPVPEAVPRLVVDSLTLGVQMAGPLLVGGLLLQLFVGLLTKVAPRLQAFFAIGPTVTAGAGLWLFSLSLPWILGQHAADLDRSLGFVAAWLAGR